MIQKVLVTPIIGLPQINGWAQVTQSLDGTFIASFSIFGSQAGNVGRDLVDLISNSSPDSATDVYALVKKVIRFVEEKDCRIQLSACYLHNGSTIFATFDGFLLLKRGSKLGCVLQSGPEVKLIEGKRVEGDVFILMTGSASTFKEEIFQKLQQGLDADTTVASIVPGVQNLPDSSLVAMAFLTDRQIGDLEEAADIVGGTHNFGRETSGLGHVAGYDSRYDDGAPLVEFSTDEEAVPVSEHDGNAVLGAPMIEVLADSGKGSKSLLDKNKLNAIFGNLLSILRKIAYAIFISFRRLIRSVIGVFSKKVYVDEKERVTNKWLRIGIGLVGIGLLLAIGFGVIRVTANNQVKAATLAVAESMATFEAAKQQMESNPIEAREKITTVIANLQAQEKSFSKQPSGQKYIQSKLKEVTTFYDSVSGKQVFNELPVFYDFQLIQSNFVANQSVNYEQFGYFFDQENKKIVKLDLESKKAETIDLASLGAVDDIDATKDSLFILGDGIFERPNIIEGEAKEVVAKGKSNEEAHLISVFNNNLYVLNQAQRNVFKYSYSDADKKFGEPIRWIKSAKDLDYDNIVSFVVDGEVWFSMKDGKVFRLTAGEGAIFDIAGLTEPFNSPVYLSTTEESKNLYLLEPAQSRLVVVSKEGEFIKEVKSVSLAAGNALIPLENQNKVLVMSGTLIFEVAL